MKLLPGDRGDHGVRQVSVISCAYFSRQSCFRHAKVSTCNFVTVNGRLDLHVINRIARGVAMNRKSHGNIVAYSSSRASELRCTSISGSLRDRKSYCLVLRIVLNVECHCSSCSLSD